VINTLDLEVLMKNSVRYLLFSISAGANDNPFKKKPAGKVMHHFSGGR